MLALVMEVFVGVLGLQKLCALACGALGTIWQGCSNLRASGRFSETPRQQGPLSPRTFTEQVHRDHSIFVAEQGGLQAQQAPEPRQRLAPVYKSFLEEASFSVDQAEQNCLPRVCFISPTGGPAHLYGNCEGLETTQACRAEAANLRREPICAACTGRVSGLLKRFKLAVQEEEELTSWYVRPSADIF